MLLLAICCVGKGGGEDCKKLLFVYAADKQPVAKILRNAV